VSALSYCCVYTEQQAATRYCPTCKLDACGDCMTAIHSMKAFAKHQVVELSEKDSVLGPSLCEVHKGRPKEMYCIDCKVFQVDRDSTACAHQNIPCCWMLPI